ncbi:hypothetical protein BU52_16405 [Streptomyces toyocaensis]|uniref:Uncharacterized protein n=1 Tax=Streptomyces toyocaensis TaxID=55952 RepID=A0A081XR27_STRTO|nr:hypothetical protein [Streptomyces toyocaensis]KES06000.1 hypothetical protein BU52_16405 [Streptomyces toyocaensis]
MSPGPGDGEGHGPTWDISFRSTVRSERLRFAEEPRTAVRFSGTGERESVSHSDRDHLPEKVVAGQDYRDVTVDYRLETRLAAEQGLARGAADTDAQPSGRSRPRR